MEQHVFEKHLSLRILWKFYYLLRTTEKALKLEYWNFFDFFSTKLNFGENNNLWENYYVRRVLRQIWNNFAYRKISIFYEKRREIWVNDFLSLYGIWAENNNHNIKAHVTKSTINPSTKYKYARVDHRMKNSNYILSHLWWYMVAWT